MALISGMESAWSPKLIGILMCKKAKFLFKSFNLVLLSLVVLSACGYKKKEHKIPYEQMPLVLSDDASPELIALLANYKTAYTPLLFSTLIDENFKFEHASLEAQTPTDPTQAESNSTKHISTGSSVEFSQNFLSKLKNSSLEELKTSLEAYIFSEVEKTETPLLYSKDASSALNPLINKRANSFSFTNLMILAWSHLHAQEDIRAQRLSVIFTPNSMSLGLVEETAQGQLLFGLNGTATGIEKKYFGPTHSLSGAIAVVDLESYIIIRAFSPFLINLSEARAFALKHSAHKFRFSIEKLTLNFKSNNPNAFELEGKDSEKIPSEDAPYPESVLSYLGDFSELGQVGLESSYKTHLDALQQAREAEILNAERAQHGANYHLVGKWPHSFGGIENLESFIRSQVVNNSATTQADKLEILILERDRNCYTGEPNENERSNEYLEKWGINNSEETWHYEEISSDKLAICRALISLGDFNAGYIKRYTRILQPVHILVPANPEGLDEATFQLKKKEIKETQRKELAPVIDNYCARLGMKRLESQSEVTQTLQVRKLWKELFFSDAQALETSQSERLVNHNAFEARCVYTPFMAVTPAAPAPAETEEARKIREKDEADQRLRDSRLRNGAPLIRQQSVSTTR